MRKLVNLNIKLVLFIDTKINVLNIEGLGGFQKSEDCSSIDFRELLVLFTQISNTLNIPNIKD